VLRAGTCLLLLAACSARCGGGSNRPPYVEVRRTPATESSGEPAPTPEPVPYVAPAEPSRAPESSEAAAETANVMRLLPEPLPEEPLAIEIRGEPFPFRNAFAWTRGGRALFVQFSTRAASECPAHPERNAPDDRFVVVVIAPLLASQGSGWRAQRPTAFLRPDLLSPGLDEPSDYPAAIEVSPSEPGDRVRGVIDAVTRRLTVRGRFEATYCGDQPGLPGTQSFPQISLEVGGEQVEVRGALVLLQDDMVRLALSSAGAECAALSHGSDIEVEVRRHYTTGQTDVHLNGHRLATQRAAMFGPGLPSAPQLAIDDVLTPGTTTRASAQFSGEVNGMPVRLRGTVDALVCPRL
jgi:hypothetical protein